MIGVVIGSGLTVNQVMTRPAVTVRTGEAFDVIANLLRRHRISGLPVVDGEGRVVGVVSENDLLRRVVRDQVGRLFGDQRAPPVETAWTLMSRPAIAIAPQASTLDALALMRRRSVWRLPVIDSERRVVGIVTRTDLLEPYALTDQELRDRLSGEILPPLGVDGRRLRLQVEQGSVLLGGTLPDPALVTQVEEAVRDTPGVVFVESRLAAAPHHA